MPTLTDHIDRILSAGECLTAVEISLRLDAEMPNSPHQFTMSEIARCADQMPNLIRAGKEYSRMPVDTNPPAPRKTSH